MAFYAMVFLLLVLRRIRWLGAFMSTLGIASSLFWSLRLLTERSPAFQGGAPKRIIVHLLYGHFARPAFMLLLHHGCFFAVGVLLWLCLLRRATASRLLALCLCCIGGSIEIYYHAMALRDMTGLRGAGLRSIVPLCLWLLSLLLIAAAVRFNLPLQALLGSRGSAVARRLGLITYPLYLLHQSIGYSLISRWHTHLPDLLSLLLTILLALLLSYAVNRYAEPPLQHLLRLILHGPTRRTPAASAP